MMGAVVLKLDVLFDAVTGPATDDELPVAHGAVPYGCGKYGTRLEYTDELFKLELEAWTGPATEDELPEAEP